MSETKLDLKEEIKRLEDKVDRLEKSLSEEREINSKHFEKIKTVYDLIYESGDIESRAVVDDLQLLRELYVRFKSFRFLLGVLFGILTITFPIILGGMKIFSIIKEWMETTGN